MNTILSPNSDGERRWIAIRRWEEFSGPDTCSPSKVLLKDYLETEWLPQKVRDGVRPTTAYDYGKVIDRYLAPHVGGVGLCDLTPRRVQSLYNSWQDAGLAAATMELARTVLTMALKQAVLWGHLKQNPAAGLRLPASTARAREGRSFTSAEAVRFIEAAGQNVEFTPCLFNLVTGLRPEEMAGLRKADVELVRAADTSGEGWKERGLVRVRQVAVWIPRKGWLYLTPKTENGVRDIYFPAHVYHAVESYAGLVASRAAQLGPAWEEGGLLFPSERGTPTRVASYGKRVARAAKAAGICGRVTPYTLRYSFATLGLLAGELDKTVSAQMGHARVDFTKDVYQKVLPEMTERLSDRLESHLFSDGRTPLAHSEVAGEM